MKTRKQIREENEGGKGTPTRPIYIGVLFSKDWTFSPPLHVLSNINKKRLKFITIDNGIEEDVFLYVYYKRDGKNFEHGEVIASGSKF